LLEEEGQRTDYDSRDGYDQMDMELRDIVYAYPWPQEHRIYRDILRKHGRRGTLLLTIDTREGNHVGRVKP
jgi:hypothetical protein